MTRKLKEEELRLMAELGYPKKAIKLYVGKVNMGAIKKIAERDIINALEGLPTEKN